MGSAWNVLIFYDLLGFTRNVFIFCAFFDLTTFFSFLLFFPLFRCNDVGAVVYQMSFLVFLSSFKKIPLHKPRTNSWLKKLSL